MGIKDNYILHEMNGEYVIIEVSDGTLEFSHVFYINSSAADMFRLMKEGLNKETIIAKMLEVYDTTKEELENDYDNFLASLKQKKIYE